MPGPQLTGKYRRAEEVVARKIVGELILVPIRGRLADLQRVFSLNELGEFVWQLLDGSRNVHAVVAAVEKEYEVSHAQAEADVVEFLGQLVEAGLVEVEDQ